ncbi:TRAP transporter substrate-binding protein [Azospirillum sp. YIM B02556]|uniref:TRAP transporter substrate-binding protein n=1 Tax=Azospirillum endophyticum TaxID=2800326 RepID=A0ABS1F166_9PROT|nr:TRAP transporter substrate-binding protein [Azospirillum endophyticum]MBK1837157.1 TRAP transporter substrate-binding protein [Azospirillum endophyticum]
MLSTRLSRRVVIAGAGSLLAAPAIVGKAQAATTLKISTSYPNDPQFSTARIWYDLFVPRLKAATDGQITAQFFPDNQLGQEADMVNQVKLGVVDMMLVGASIWTNIVPEFGIFDLGYLFQDYDHLLRATATPAGADLEKLLVQKAGAHFPAWGRNIGARNFITKFAFTDSAGLAGRKIRSLPSPVVTETVRLMGAAATPMAFGEVYTGLQAGVIDGMEHDAPTILSAKFYETAKHFTLTRHIHTPFGAFVSDKTLQKLSSNLRDGLLQAVRETAKDQFAKAAQVELEAIDQLKQKGVTVAECDREGFRKRMQPLWDKFAQQTPGAKALLDAVHQTEKA